MHYCFELNHREVCIRVPVAYDQFSVVLKPDPTPWVIDELLIPRVEQDINILSAIDKLADALTPELRESFHNEINRSIKKLELPMDVTVELMSSACQKKELNSKKS